VDISVLLSVATNPLKVSNMNDLQIAGMEKGDPDLVWFGCCHPHCPQWKEELHRLADAGIKGIKLHPQYQGVAIDDPANLRVLEVCGELGLVVLIHSGRETAFPGLHNSHPYQVRDAVRQVGPVKLVAAHMRALQECPEGAEVYADLPSVCVDTSFSLRHLKPGQRGYYTQENMHIWDGEDFAKQVRILGADRVVFATDSPWRDQKQSVAGIRALSLTDEEKEWILYKTAARLLQL
jgi:predicted TIM-barrel fold metal-dependent hydrolase